MFWQVPARAAGVRAEQSAQLRTRADEQPGLRPLLRCSFTAVSGGLLSLARASLSDSRTGHTTLFGLLQQITTYDTLCKHIQSISAQRFTVMRSSGSAHLESKVVHLSLLQCWEGCTNAQDASVASWHASKACAWRRSGYEVLVCRLYNGRS